MILIGVNAQANEDDQVVGLLIAAKFTGVCGIFKQLSEFQGSTKMPGGDDFIVRFVNTEMARMGTTLPEFATQCASSIKQYTNTMTALGFE